MICSIYLDREASSFAARFRHTAEELRDAVGAVGTLPLCKALRDHLGIDSDESCCHEFVFGSQRHLRYSDNALRSLQNAMHTLDMDAVWQAHKPSGRNKVRVDCTLSDCRAA